MKKLIFLLLLTGCALKAEELIPTFSKSLKPTQTPVIFFKGSISQENTVQWNNSFTDNGREIIYTIAPKGKPSYLVTQSWDGDNYSEMNRILVDTAFPYSDPHFSPKGDYLLTSSAKSFFEGDTTQRNFNLWKSKKGRVKWGTPELIQWEGFDNGCFYPSVTQSHDIYFAYNEKEGERNSNIYKAIWNGKTYEWPERLPASINSDKFEGDPFIDRKERFLIFAGFDREDNYGKSDLYISFKEGNQWTRPINLGEEINSHGYDGSPYVTADDSYLIFTSSRAPDGSENEEYFNVFYVSFDLEKYRNQSSIK